MTNDDFPAGVSPTVEAWASAPLDADDEALLAEVSAAMNAFDPVPADLVERVQFALALDELYAEVAEITRVPEDALAVRSDPVTGMRTETLTFSAESLTAMVTVTRSGSELVRVDGWVAPPGRRRVVCRMQEGSQEVVTDESGRFVFEDLPEGFAQLTFGDAESEDGASVVTPLFQL